MLIREIFSHGKPKVNYDESRWQVMADALTITMDGVEFKAQPGKMLLEAAIEAGLYVPYLCYHPGMKPFAACRLCVVEVEGGRGFPASCTLPVQDGMVVNSKSQGVEDLRRSVMEMLISEHPSGCLTCHRVDLCGPEDICLRHVSVNDRCVTCPKNERCELKDTTRHMEVPLESPLSYKYRDIPIDTGDPFYDRDYNLCIVCGRCVRVCEEVRGDSAITFTQRAGRSLVGTSHGTSLLESGCEFCGACLDVCPVGALVERDHKWEKAVQVKRTICPFCPVGCQLNLEVNKFGKVIRTIPELSSPTNRGQACFKGKFGMEFINKKSRLTKPLMRREGSSVLEEASWDEVLDYIASKLPTYKGDQFGMLTAPDSTNEEHYLAQKFARSVMVTNNVDQASDIRPGLSSGLMDVLGYDAATNPIWQMESSACILGINTNITEEHNVVALPIKKAVKAGAKLIIIDPREVELTRYAHLWLRPRPGAEIMVLGGMLKVIFAEGLEQKEVIEEHCDGIDNLLASIQNLDLADIARQTGVSADNITDAARAYAGSGCSSIFYALDNIPQEMHHDYGLAIADLALVTGNIGRPSTGIYPLRPGANEQGARDVGCLPHMLPGHRFVANADDRSAMEEFWGNLAPFEPGLDLVGMLQGAVEGALKAMYVVGDLAAIAGDPSPYGEPTWTLADLKACMENLDLLVVQDHFLTELGELAHVVLPRASFAEKTGTYTNLERRIQLFTPAIRSSEGEAKPEFQVVCEVAKRMGSSGFDFDNPAQVMDEIASIVPSYGGVSHRRLEAEARRVFRPDPSNPLPTQVLYSDKEYRGLQWPCSAEDHAGTAELYAEGFPRGKAVLASPDFRAILPPHQDELPFLYLPGRLLLQPKREATILPGRQNQLVRQEVVEMNPKDAGSGGFHDGDLVEVKTPSKTFQAQISVVAGVPEGSISCTSLFGQLAAEVQASPKPDPMYMVPGLAITGASVSGIGAR